MVSLAKHRYSKFVFLAAAAALAGGAWYWYSGNGQANQTAAQMVTVSRGNIEEVVTAQGKLEPKQYVDVGTQVSGQLKKIHVDIGASVKQQLNDLPTSPRRRAVQWGFTRTRASRHSPYVFIPGFVRALGFAP